MVFIWGHVIMVLAKYVSFEDLEPLGYPRLQNSLVKEEALNHIGVLTGM